MEEGGGLGFWLGRDDCMNTVSVYQGYHPSEEHM